MDLDFARENWALVAALFIGAVVAFFIAHQTLRNTASGQLRRVRADLEDEQRSLRKALAVARKAEARVDRLMNQADRVKPRVLQEAREALNDARALAKIADDKFMVAENHVRRVIHEEFPPAKQQKLRNLYLPEGRTDKQPFSFSR